MTSSAIEPMLALSTTHLAEQTCNAWLRSSTVVAYEKADYGWFLPVPEEDGEDLPADLAACFAFARSRGCDWVMFDRDAAILAVLQTFDW